MAWGKNGTPYTATGTVTAMEISDLNTETFNTFLVHAPQATANNFQRFRMGSGSLDTGTNYNTRRSPNGGSEITSNDNVMQLAVYGGTSDGFVVGYFINIASEEKLVIAWECNQNTAGAGNAPNREDSVAKWANTSNASDYFEVHSDGASMAVDSNLSALGSDLTPAAAIPALTNVQDNSLFIEPSTGKRYWFDEAVTYTDEDIIWDSTTAVNVSISGNTVTKTSSIAWDSVARSTQTWTPSDEPTLDFTVLSDGVTFEMVGFGKGTLGTNHSTLDFSIYAQSNYIIFENNAVVYTSSITPVSSDTLKVTMDSNGLVKYYVNNSLLYTSTQTASGTYYAQFAGYQTGASTTMTYSSTTPATWTMNPTIEDDLTTNNGWVFPTNSSYDSTNDQINLTIASNSFDVSYIDLQKAVYFGSGNNLDDDKFIIRARITKNNDLGNTSKGSSLLLQVSSALTDSSKSPNPQDAVGMRIDTDRTGGANYFYVHSTDNGTFWTGESSGISYSWGTGDLYWEIIGDGTNVTGELFTGSDYSTGSLGKVTTSQQSPTGMRYLKFCGFNDPSRTATQFSLQDFKIWNGVTTPN